MKQYLELLQDIRDNGIFKTDRTGTGTYSVFGRLLRFDLSQGFPLVTTKKLHIKSILVELLWFLRGDTNINWLNQNGCTIWDEWADEKGDLGPIYGKQWRSWPDERGGTIDQISWALESIKTDPDSRRIVVSSWNVAELDQMELQPCHCLFQFYVADGKLSCAMFQRSCDTFLGLPFNIPSYAFLTHMFAQQANLEVGEFIWVGGDIHLYQNHLEQAELQLTREPFPLPQLRMKRIPRSIFEYNYEDFEIVGYESHPHIKAPVAV